MDDFNSIESRRDRLCVLAGNLALDRVHTLKRVYLPEGRYDANKIMAVADAIFTDLGVLIVPFARFRASDYLATSGGLLGAVGDAALTAIEGGLDATDHQTALATYEKRAAAAESQPLAEIFAQNRASCFLPADELEPFQLDTQRNIVMTCRGQNFILQWERHPTEMPPLGDWRNDAIAKRQLQFGGPEKAGLAALYEWSNRPQEAVPEWVGQAAQRLVDDQAAPHTFKLCGQLPGERTRWLITRLRQADDQRLQSLAKVLSTMQKASDAQRLGRMLLAIIVIGLIVAMLIGWWMFVRQYRRF